MLTPEDHELWSRVAKTTVPLHPELFELSLEVSEVARGGESSPPVVQYAEPPLKRGHARRKAENPADHSYVSSPPAMHRGQQLRMDHKVYKKMTQGRLRPEAKLDLHGMTLSEAESELVQFILSCQAKGFRLVLVITGKGSREIDSGSLLVQRRGVLRHQVPQWLHSGPLARSVQQLTPAHMRHGGTGAYYVYLRR